MYLPDDVDSEDEAEELTPWRLEMFNLYPEIFDGSEDVLSARESFYLALAGDFVEGYLDTWEQITSRTTDKDGLVRLDDLFAARELSKMVITDIVASRAREADEDNDNEKRLRILIDEVKKLHANEESADEKEIRLAERKAALRAVDDENTLARAASILALRAVEEPTNPELA